MRRRRRKKRKSKRRKKRMEGRTGARGGSLSKTSNIMTSIFWRRRPRAWRSNASFYVIHFIDSSRPPGIPGEKFLIGCPQLLVGENPWLWKQLLLRHRGPAEITVWKVTGMAWAFQMYEMVAER